MLEVTNWEQFKDVIRVGDHVSDLTLNDELYQDEDEDLCCFGFEKFRVYREGIVSNIDKTKFVLSAYATDTPLYSIIIYWENVASAIIDTNDMEDPTMLANGDIIHGETGIGQIFHSGDLIKITLKSSGKHISGVLKAIGENYIVVRTGDLDRVISKDDIKKPNNITSFSIKLPDKIKKVSMGQMNKLAGNLIVAIPLADLGTVLEPEYGILTRIIDDFEFEIIDPGTGKSKILNRFYYASICKL